jgi:hypothetical protein
MVHRCIVEGGVELKQPTYTGLSLELKVRVVNCRPCSVEVLVWWKG